MEDAGKRPASACKCAQSIFKDVYSEKKIIKDQVVPEDFVYRSPGYMPQCEGIAPSKGIYSNISGIDLVKGKDAVWYVLEDNLRIPSGASYPLIARSLCRRCSPDTFRSNNIIDNRNYGDLLRHAMDSVNTGGINVVFTPGRYNAAYFEHSFLAERLAPFWRNLRTYMWITAVFIIVPVTVI